MSRNSTGPSPSANPARRSLLETLNPFPRRPASNYNTNDSPLLHPDSASPARMGFPRSITPPTSQATHVDSPELGGPAQQVSYSPPLLHPSLPYGGRSDRPDSNVSSRRSSFASDRPAKGDLKARPMSLSVNYVPAKFTRMHTQGESSAASIGMRRRRKVGGGREAFADDAGRMGHMGMIDDDEGVEYKMARGGVRRKAGKKRGLRWNRFKAVLFAANTVIMLYGLATLVAAILVWLNVFTHADVIRVGNKTELIVSTVAAALCTLTAVFGYSGIILNNRAFLAVYNLLLWIDLGFIAAPGYLSYKQRTFNLEGKLNQQWSRYLGTEGRLRIQDALVCCGYFSPFIEATQSPLCYSRSNLPGCKGRYLRLERTVLHTWYAVAFGIVGAHILIIIAALLCSNHVTYRFGKGLTPKRYRLDLRSMGIILDDYANQIAAQFGDDVAQEALTRSQSRSSATHAPMAQDNLIDFANSRRNSFAPSQNNAVPSPNPNAGPSRAESHNGTFTTSSTGYNSNAQYPPDALGAEVGQQGRKGQNRDSAGDWYKDAEEDDELGRMEVSTGYGSEMGDTNRGSTYGQPAQGHGHGHGQGQGQGQGQRNSVGWAQ